MNTIDNVKPEENNIQHYRGDLFDEVWQISKDDGSPYSLNGKTVILTIKKHKSDTTEEDQLTTTAGDIVISGTDFDTITFSKVVDLDPYTYFYDVEVVEDTYTISYGTWLELGDIT